MTTPTFTWIPSRADLAKKPKFYTAQFGDGYRQDMPIGLNNNPQVWSVVFSDASTSDAIMAFLDGLNGGAMYWQPPRQSAALAFKCFDYRQTNAPGQSTVTATFEQAFGY